MKTIVNRHNTLRTIIPGIAASALLLCACNSDSEPEYKDLGSETTVAITKFSLKKDESKNVALDSVFFSIDLDNGVIFNADSLPMGTDVTDLVPVISYPSSVSGAVITMEGGSKRTGEVNYMETPSDSIDFSGKVFLKLTAQDGETQRTYRLKVNVHTVPSDSLIWSQVGSSQLPSQHANPTAQKSVKHNNAIYCMIREENGSLTLSTTENPSAEDWNITPVSELGKFQIRTFTAATDAFYILDEAGILYTSADAITWNATPEKWINILGGYSNNVLGIKSENGELHHASYPTQINNTKLEEGFPVRDYSNLASFENKWSTTPTSFIVGGIDADNNIVSSAWAFDGTTWAQISQYGAMSLRQATLIPYYAYRTVSGNSNISNMEMNVWLLMGGITLSGELNSDVYISYDNGVNWQRAVDYLQLPQEFALFSNADAIVLEHELNANLKDYWTRKPARLPFIQNGYDLSWQCPYIYLTGGYNSEGIFMNTIRRGVLNKLTFTPIL